jgi:hypothetical protein
MLLRPFFTYYGGKYRAAPRYPRPTVNHIIEPFAGSAGYALRYYGRPVTLYDRDPNIVRTWDYLIRTPASEIRRLPSKVLSVDEMRGVPPEAKLLVGWWLNKGCAAPCKTMSAWGRRGTHDNNFWGEAIRDRIAQQVDCIRHWSINHAGYDLAPNVFATWFVDPPYKVAGKHYRFGASQVDYAHLANWCRERMGHVIVCENEGATWLPFRPFLRVKASEARHGGKVSKEAVWQQVDGSEVPLDTQRSGGRGER